MKIKMLILNLPSFLNFSFFLLSLLYHTYGIFSVKDFSTTTRVRILKFGTKLGIHEFYCVAKTATYCLSVPLFVHFSFSPMEISVTDLSAPIGASVFKFCVHLQVNTKQPHIAYQSLYLFIFIPSNDNCCQISQLLLEPVFSMFVFTFREANWIV